MVGNLGPYQEIVMRAKDVGGVDQLIQSIEKAAELRSAPKFVAMGALAGAGGVAGAVAVRSAFQKRLALREAAADEARAHLTELAAKSGPEDPPNAEGDDSPEG